MGTRDPLALLVAARLSEDDRAAIAGGNAARLLGGRP
jgi:predicted TIM-barrel fold metal-dependent hydrolase